MTSKHWEGKDELPRRFYNCKSWLSEPGGMKNYVSSVEVRFANGGTTETEIENICRKDLIDNAINNN